MTLLDAQKKRNSQLWKANSERSIIRTRSCRHKPHWLSHHVNNTRWYIKWWETNKNALRTKNCLTNSNFSIQRRDRLSADCAVLHPAEYFPGTEFNAYLQTRPLPFDFEVLILPSKMAFFQCHLWQDIVCTEDGFFKNNLGRVSFHASGLYSGLR